MALWLATRQEAHRLEREICAFQSRCWAEHIKHKLDCVRRAERMQFRLKFALLDQVEVERVIDDGLKHLQLLHDKEE